MAEKEIPEWLRKKRMGTLSLEEYGQELDRKVAAGEMTPEEAEDEWQDYRNRGEGRWGWSWQR